MLDLSITVRLVSHLAVLQQSKLIPRCYLLPHHAYQMPIQEDPMIIDLDPKSFQLQITIDWKIDLQ